MAVACTHKDRVLTDKANTNGCEECLKTGGKWVQLRLCRECGHVGCCDSSPGTHATKHFGATKHPIMSAFGQGSQWNWCYVDKDFIDL